MKEKHDKNHQLKPCQVVAAQRLQIGIELGARILVALGVPAQPAACIQVEQILELAFAENTVADDMDVLDARGLPFGNVEGQVHLIARHRRDGFLSNKARTWISSCFLQGKEYNPQAFCLYIQRKK